MHYSHDRAKGYRVSRSCLAPSSRAPLLDHAVDRIRRRTRRRIYPFYARICRRVLTNFFFFLVDRRVAKRNGRRRRNKFCESFFFFFDRELCDPRWKSERERERDKRSIIGLDYGTRRCCAVVARKTNWCRSKRIEIELSSWVLHERRTVVYDRETINRHWPEFARLCVCELFTILSAIADTIVRVSISWRLIDSSTNENIIRR